MNVASKSPAPKPARAEREYHYSRPVHEVPAQPTRLPTLDDYDQEICPGGWRK